jgi:hypothetical protein
VGAGQRPELGGYRPLTARFLPFGALLGVIGAVLPWFHPSEATGTLVASSMHSWQDGKLGVIGPILMLVVGLMSLGSTRRPRPTGTTRMLGRAAIVAGGLTGIGLAIAWALVPHQYSEGRSWDSYVQAGYRLTRGPQSGFYLTALAAVIFVLVGAALLVRSRPGSGPPEPASIEAARPHSDHGMTEREWLVQPPTPTEPGSDPTGPAGPLR